MKYSVIIPIYKVEKYLRRCVDSVLAQTLSDCEIILVDDGSPDNCPEICDEYALNDSRIKVIHKENGGLSSARNAGIKIATGEYIGFVDSDDYVEPNMYETLYNALQESGADMAVCEYAIVDEKGAVKSKSIVEKGVFTPFEMFEKLDKLGGYYVASWSKLYKKTILKNNLFPEGRLHEDAFTTHRFFGESNKIVCVDKVLYNYLERPNSIMTATYSEKRLDVVDALIERYFYYKEKKYSGAKVSLQAANMWYRHGENYLTYIEHRNILKQKLTTLFPLLLKEDFVGAIRLKLHCFKKQYHDKKFWTKVKKEVLSKVKKARKNNTPIIFYFTLPEYNNLGDQAIYSASKKFFDNNFSEYCFIPLKDSQFFKFKTLIEKFVVSKDIVIVNGGGILGTLWESGDDRINEVISFFYENKVVVFPQTCFYSNDEAGIARLNKNKEIYSKAKDLTILLRDKKSYDFTKENFPDVKCELAPDIVLSLENVNVWNLKRDGVLLCLRSDHENVRDENNIEDIKTILTKKCCNVKYTDTVINGVVNDKNREEELQKKWKEFSSAKLVITDRLHGMIFCAITGTPCIALNNISKKVEGGYEWIKELPFIFLSPDKEKVESVVDDALLGKIKTSQRYKYPKNQLKEIILQHIKN